MKHKIILSLITIVCLCSTVMFANNVLGGEDNPGAEIDNPWAYLFTTQATTTAEETTTQEPTTEAPTETTSQLPEGYYHVENYKGGGVSPYPASGDNIFAGWYTDETCTTPYMEDTGVAYAKFIDKNVFSVKFQEAYEGDAIKHLRFLSTIDCVDYSEIGFIINGNVDGKTITNKNVSCTKIYRTLTAANQIVEPTVFSPSSQYFFAYVVRNMTVTESFSFTVKPYVVTLDGTTVMGIPKSHQRTIG